MFGGAWADATLDTFMSIEQSGDTVIGNDVWIGRGATIMPGISIADGAVIGAYSVVSKEVGAYEIVAGNPARVLLQRFTDSAVAAPANLRWWEDRKSTRL